MHKNIPIPTRIKFVSAPEITSSHIQLLFTINFHTYEYIFKKKCTSKTHFITLIKDYTYCNPNNARLMIFIYVTIMFLVYNLKINDGHICVTVQKSANVLISRISCTVTQINQYPMYSHITHHNIEPNYYKKHSFSTLLL